MQRILRRVPDRIRHLYLRWYAISRRIFRFASRLLLILAGLGGLVLLIDVGYRHQLSGRQSLLAEFYANIVTELVFFLFTVLVIDTLYRRRDQKREKQRLIRQLGSIDHGLAMFAAKELKELGSFEDGSLHGLWLGEANLQGIDVLSASLVETKLVMAKLDRAKLSGANLIGADLTGASMRGADLYGADLSFSTMVKTDLTGTQMWRAKLRRAGLEGANLSGADLHNSTFVSADLEGALLEGAHIANVDFSKAYMARANLANTRNYTREPTLFVRARLQAAILSRADLDGADMTNADLRWATLDGTFLRQATLEAADLRYTDLRRARLEKARLPSANLTQATVTEEKLLSLWKLRGAKLGSGVVYDGRYNLEGDLNRAHEDGVDLQDADALADWYGVTREEYELGQLLRVATQTNGDQVNSTELRLKIAGVCKAENKLEYIGLITKATENAFSVNDREFVITVATDIGTSLEPGTHVEVEALFDARTQIYFCIEVDD